MSIIKRNFIESVRKGINKINNMSAVTNIAFLAFLIATPPKNAFF